uniref:Uncharacterized protein n=1 Tax=Siphoviridae sp. ctHip2 TaxID=2827830 RepID=A0A8S5RW60_9CAUD|nr:MAG TPA: hypothetical protein [Siphoviridae sp. ctHip2]
MLVYSFFVYLFSLCSYYIISLKTCQPFSDIKIKKE